MLEQVKLRFTDKAQEKDFNEWYLPLELKVFRYALLLGIVTYFVFVPLDKILYNEYTANQFLILRITIAVIVIIAYGLTFLWINNPKQYQIFAISMAIICFGVNVSFTFFKDVEEFYFYTGNSILIIFIFILLNIRFTYLIFIAIFYVSVHLLMLKINFDYDFQGFAHQAFGIISVASISLVSNWIIEYQKRQNFLNNRIIEEQKEALETSIEEKDKLLVTLQERNQELDAFNHSVSHDLKTPLRHINTFSKLLAEEYQDKLDTDAQEYLAFISDGTEKMDTLINDLLSYSKMRHTELAFEPVNMNHLVESVFEELTVTLEKKPVLIKSELPEIKGDSVLLTQVWNNLISNASKYSSNRETIKIEIGAKKSEKEVTYYIRDNGIGFDKDSSNQLFKLFSRLNNARRYSGTGVGLSLVHRIIKKHRGKIWAEGELDKGSTFYFVLPLNPDV